MGEKWIQLVSSSAGLSAVMPIGQGGEQRVVREEGVRADLKRRGGEDKPNDVDARNDGVM